MSLEYEKSKIGFARHLRRNATPWENRLWYDFLRGYAVRFQRQKTIGNFIVDFYCHEAKLVIEIDGEHHQTEKGITKNCFRTKILEGYDLRVIRFTNCQIDRNFVGVCEYVDETVKAILLEK